MTDFDTLTTNGIIAFYESCEITELFLIRKKDNAIFNFFTLVVFEEKPFKKLNEKFLTDKPIKVNDEYALGMKRFQLSMVQAEEIFRVLKIENKWNTISSESSQFPKLKYLPKQFIPALDENRLNKILKNNFHNGSYILEFFDEEKVTVNFLLRIEVLNKLNELSEKIKQYVPIDLSIVRDRIGNFIFQFPITILEVDYKAMKEWNGTEITFDWHLLIDNIPDCLLQVESTFDKNYMGCIIEDYNKLEKQEVVIGNLDQINHIKIWRKEPSLIISSFKGTYLRSFEISGGLINQEPRLFEIDGSIVSLQITGKDRGGKKTKKTNYTSYISNNLYDAEKIQLEKTLSFKQYIHVDRSFALNDLKKLIEQYDKNGVYLWDPYLRSKDILETLFFSKTAGVELRAIGSTNDNTEKVFGNKGKRPSEIISAERLLLDNPTHNNFGLNLEYRMQHAMKGWKFHDRFLIFPGNENERSKVYALGTSVNSFGTEHNILQEVSHPQPVVDAFNELWDKLNHPKCIVWKFPK